MGWGGGVGDGGHSFLCFAFSTLLGKMGSI